MWKQGRSCVEPVAPTEEDLIQGLRKRAGLLDGYLKRPRHKDANLPSGQALDVLKEPLRVREEREVGRRAPLHVLKPTHRFSSLWATWAMASFPCQADPGFGKVPGPPA